MDSTRANLLARVIAFRGTDKGSSSDFFHGLLGNSQRNGAREVYGAERAALDVAGMGNVPIEVTGHSLGGALATQISIDNPGVKAFVFNTSPFFGGDPLTNATARTSIYKRGEFLRALRTFKAPPAADAFVINCNPSASAGRKHNIRKLADCLTWVAAYDDDTALALLDADDDRIMKSEVECGEFDKPHPALTTVVALPCDHAPIERSTE